MEVDGKYGWFVVCSAFAIGFIVDGIQLSFGLLLIALLDTFGQGRAPTAIIGSLVVGLAYLLAPLAGLLSERFGCRIVVVAGSLISSSGLIISVFVDKLAYLYVTYGILVGSGFGLMVLPSRVCLMKHFEKRRALAIGVAMCGSGAGTFVFSVLTGFLLEEYGWRGTIFIYAGIVLNGVVCGLILVSPHKQEITSSTNPTGRHSNSELADSAGDRSKYTSSVNEDSGVDSVETDVSFIDHRKECSSNQNLGFDMNIDDSDVEVNNDRNTNNGLTDNKIHAESAITTFNGNSDISSNAENTIPPVSTAAPIFKLANTHNAKKGDINVAGIDDSMRNDKEHKTESSCHKVCDCSLLKNVKLVTLLCSVFFSALGYPVPFNFIPDQAVESGMDTRQAYWLTSSMGIANIVSRITIGFISDLKFVNRVVLFEGLLASLGIATLVSVLLVSFEAKLVYTCVYGFLIGGFVVLVDVVIADLFGIEVVARSLGLLLFTIGTGSLVSAPIAGGLYDKTGNYDITFVVAGSEFVLGACIYPIPFLVEKFNKNRSYRLDSS